MNPASFGVTRRGSVSKGNGIWFDETIACCGHQQLRLPHAQERAHERPQRRCGVRD